MLLNVDWITRYQLVYSEDKSKEGICKILVTSSNGQNAMSDFNKKGIISPQKLSNHLLTVREINKIKGEIQCLVRRIKVATQSGSEEFILGLHLDVKVLGLDYYLGTL